MSAFDEALVGYLSAKALAASVPDNGIEVAGQNLADLADEVAYDAFWALVETRCTDPVDMIVKLDIMNARGGDASLFEIYFMPAIEADLRAFVATSVAAARLAGDAR